MFDFFKVSSIYNIHLQVFVLSQWLDSSLYSLFEVLSPLKHLMFALDVGSVDKITCLLLHEGNHFFHQNRSSATNHTFLYRGLLLFFIRLSQVLGECFIHERILDIEY